jgi:hypothetical protein
MMAVLALSVTACGGKQQLTVEEEQQRVLQIDSVDAKSGIQRMKTTHYEEDITLGSRKFHVAVTREPDDEAPAVKSDVGTFVDNKVSLRLTRADGTQWVSRSFRKSDFGALAGSESYARHFILEGMVYDDERSAAEHLPVFAASISVPLTDLYIPFVVMVSAGGDVQITRDEDMDVLPDVEDTVQ